MKQSIVALLLAACFALPAWAQAPEGQSDLQATPTEQKPAEEPAASHQQPGVSPADPNAPSAPGVETTEFPLDKFQNFSAIENGGPVPGLDSDVHIYRSGNLMRAEGSDKLPGYFITDLVKRNDTMVNSRDCLKMSVSYIRTFPFFVPEEGARYQVAPAGEATVDGHHCKVEDVKIYRPKRSEVPEFRLYEADDLDGFPIKIENHRPRAYHWVITYKDVRLGPQDSSLFIVPEKCESTAAWKQITPGKSGASPKKAPAKAIGSKPSSKTSKPQQKDQQNNSQSEPPKQP
jgi:hypothetical protein